MDLPPVHHHRYVPTPPKFSDNPNFYHSQPHRLPPPPPLPLPSLPPPAPPPQHHLSLPPLPPLPSAVQTQVSFRPNPTIEERSPKFSNFIPSHLLNHSRPPPRPPSPPRVASYHHNNRNHPRFEDNSRFSDPWLDLPPLPRFPPEPPLHHHNHHRPISPLRPDTESCPTDFQRSLRFRNEFMDEGFRDSVNPQLPLWGRKEVHLDAHDDMDDHKYRYRARYDCNSDRMDRDFVSGDSQGTGFSLNPSREFVGNYDLYNNREEDLRWGDSRLETDCAYGDNNGFSLHLRSERRELFESSDYDDVSRFNHNRVGEKRADEFFSRSPRKKQLQKKSALLRIQLGKVNNNNRNRSHDHNHFQKSYHDESNSIGGGSFKGKEKDVFVRLERKREEEREKSPVELDVSFKSNALVAKAKKATPSSVVDSNGNLMPRNRKIREMDLSDSPGIKLGENLNETVSYTNHPSTFDKDCQELAKNATTDKTDQPTRGSHHPVRFDKRQKSAEKVSAVRTDSCIRGSDIPSDSDKDLGQLAKKIRVSAGGLQPCSSGLGGNSANKESPKSVESGQGDKGVASDGRKRKRVAIPLQSKRDSREPTKGKSSSADCPSQTIPLDEGASGSAGMGIVSAVASEFLTDDLADEIAKHSSQVASNFKKQDVDIKSSQLFLPQSSATASVLQYSGDVYVCEATDHAEISVRDGYSVLNFDKVVDHPFQDEPLLLESGPARKVMDLVEGNATEEDKVYDGQIDAYTSRNEGYSTSSSENRFCRRSAKVDVADSMNTICEESLPNQVRAAEVNDIVEGSSNPVTPVGSNAFLCFSEIDKTTVNQVATNEICSNTHTLGIRMISNTCLLDDTTKQSLDAATTVSENGSIERPQNFMVSDMDGFSNNYIKVHSPRSKGKRKATDDQLRIYDTKMSEIAAEKVSNGHYEDANLSFSEKNIVTVEEEVVPGDWDDILKKGCSGVYSEVNLSVEEGKAMFHSPISLAPVLSNAYQNPNGGDTSTPSTEVPPNTEEVKTRTEHGIALCTSDDMTSACSEPSVVLLREDTIATHSDQAVSLEDGSMARCSKMEPLTSSLSKLEDVPKGNTTLVISTVDLQPGSVDVASGGSRDNFVGSINQKASYGDDNCEINLPYMENLASLSHNLSLCADVNCVLSTNSADRLVDSDPEALLNNMTSPSEDVPSYLVLDMQNSKSRASQIPNGHSGKEKIFTKSPVSDVDTARPSSLSSRTDAKFGQELIHPVNSKSVLPLSQNNSKVIHNSNSLNSLPEKSSLSYNRLTASIHWGFSGRTSVKYPSTGKAPAFKNASRPRTWHRTGTSSHSVVKNVSLQTNSQKELGKVPSSYIRKGNSLVRKPSPVGSVPQGLHANTPAICRLSPGIDNLKRGRGSENSINLIGPSTSTTMEGLIAGPERPKTPPLTGIVKSLNCTPVDQGDSTCSPLADPFANDCPGETFDLSKSTENMDVKMCSVDGLKPSAIKECEAGSRSNLDGRSTIDERNSGKKITYVKRKANQLVAASNASDPSFQGSEKPQALSSDGYYKRRKNQLIRTSEDSVKQRAVIPDKCLSSHRQESQKNTRNRSSSKKQSGFAKKKFSLVWTLHGTLSSKKDGNSGHFHRVRPFLFPWKRATYWTNFMHCLSSMPNDNLASAISRKLVLSRKSDMIYKKSISGFSLRRSKVLSFCGRSLKWTKSMERNSRKVNEDATLAAVAVEKRKREQNGAAFTRFNSRIYVPRERIFRIGSERYRMDPSGKTLQRISGEKPSYSEYQSENNAKKSFVPRRLLIGNDEYVRIGNGNQLIRDPKKRTRVLANEKVRWSLHTARLRLARKKKYCQFFTRFGKCKDDKKCPYIHDPSKIAVCTKFLNGSCSNPNCKLTHEVIPERMQDCSYFLQGLCSNESCPYRHVNVNPNSPICEGFLRGYCADGNECRKKHTYLCPEFEATGNCQQDAKCKLHHPKNKKKGIKSKASNVQKNARGRYFGARPLDVANSRTTVPKITVGECDDHIFCQDGKFTDFISLAGSEEAMEEVVEPTVELSCDSDREEPSDIQDLDELIKPIRIMNKNLVLDSSPAIDNSGEMTASYVSESSFADEVAILDAPYSASAE